ncbi:MAG: hypothetical protein ACOYOB_18275 [Myxococcota bacterium]
MGGLLYRVVELLVEWTLLHRRELAADWARAEQGEPLEPIAPLE